MCVYTYTYIRTYIYTYIHNVQMYLYDIYIKLISLYTIAQRRKRLKSTNKIGKEKRGIAIDSYESKRPYQ